MNVGSAARSIPVTRLIASMMKSNLHDPVLDHVDRV